MIKKFVLIFLVSGIYLMTAGQNVPVAVSDTASATLGQYVTVNVISNDYHPDGLEFKVTACYGAVSFTDSTLTFYMEYDRFYHQQTDTLKYGYQLKDENGDFGLESFGNVWLLFDASHYTDTIDIGNISASIFSYASLFWPGPTQEDHINHFEFPKGSGKSLNFSTKLWLGGIDGSGNLRLAAERYRQTGIDYWEGPLSVSEGNVSIDTATPVNWHRAWKLSSAEINHHLAHWQDIDYNPIENIKNWPAHGDESLDQSHNLAPYVDVDGDNQYDPYKGDYPLIKGDQCVFFIFNDWRFHTETQGESIGLEAHAMAYAFDEPENDAFFNTVFINYRLINRSSQTFSETYLGIFSDFDIGFALDDYIGCDVSRGAFYGYNGNEIDGNGEPQAYGENPPAQAVVFLGGPYLDANDTDDPSGGCDESINGVGFGDGVVDNERYGLTNFMSWWGGSSIHGAPNVADEYYNYLQSKWRNGTPLTYGGDGYSGNDSIGVRAKFLFPGLTDPCWWGTNGTMPDGDPDWKEETSVDGEPSVPADRRGIGSMGPFTFLAGATHNIDIAFVAARGDDGPYSSVDLLKIYIDTVRGRFFQNPDDFGNQWLALEEETINNQDNLKVYPNPATDELWIDYNADGRTIIYSIYDLYGRQLITKQISTVSTFSISLNEFEEGIYIVTIHDKNLLLTAKILKR